MHINIQTMGLAKYLRPH